MLRNKYTAHSHKYCKILQSFHAKTLFVVSYFSKCSGGCKSSWQPHSSYSSPMFPTPDDWSVSKWITRFTKDRSFLEILSYLGFLQWNAGWVDVLVCFSIICQTVLLFMVSRKWAMTHFFSFSLVCGICSLSVTLYKEEKIQTHWDVALTHNLKFPPKMPPPFLSV